MFMFGRLPMMKECLFHVWARKSLSSMPHPLIGQNIPIILIFCKAVKHDTFCASDILQRRNTDSFLALILKLFQSLLKLRKKQHYCFILTLCSFFAAIYFCVFALLCDFGGSQMYIKRRALHFQPKPKPKPKCSDILSSLSFILSAD